GVAVVKQWAGHRPGEHGQEREQKRDRLAGDLRRAARERLEPGRRATAFAEGRGGNIGMHGGILLLPPPTPKTVSWFQLRRLCEMDRHVLKEIHPGYPCRFVCKVERRQGFRERFCFSLSDMRRAVPDRCERRTRIWRPHDT